MATAFDHIAEQYDHEFTYSEVGRRQRRRVWDYLDEMLPENRPLQVLELNCGTGEDAIYFAARGHYVTATDLSKMMVKATRRKVARSGMGDRVEVKRISLEHITEYDFDRKFDLVFSDFGGLNCVDEHELQRLAHVVARVLNPGGRFISVIMPQKCLAETAYFLSKFKWKKAFRRATTHEVSVNIEGHIQNTWFHSPSKFKKIFAQNFDFVGQAPIGFFLPPSYLNRFFIRRLKWLTFLDKMERKYGHISLLAPYSDHYLIDLQVK